MSTLESLVLQSEQYHPVAQSNLHKDLKLRLKKKHYICQATKYCPVFCYKTSMGIYQVVSFPDSCVQEMGNKARLSGSQQDPYEFLAGVCAIWFEVLSIRHWKSSVWTNFTKRKSDMRVRRHWHCDLYCQVELIANLLHSFYSAVILSTRSF